MKKNLKVILIFCFVCIGLFTQCKIENESKSQQNTPETKSEYKQVFSEYHLEVKTPIELADISNESNHQFALHYGAVEHPNDKNKLTAYQFMISIPSNYEQGRAIIKSKLLKTNNLQWSECYIGENGNIQAYVSRFNNKGVETKSLAIFTDDYILGINVMSNTNLDEKFQYVTDNIFFTKELDKHHKENKHTSQKLNFDAKTYESDKYTILHPSSYDIIEKPFPNVDVAFVSPSNGVDYQPNFNVVVDMNNNKTLEEIIIRSVTQLKELPYNYQIISNDIERINGLKYSKIVSNSVMMGYPVRSSHYTLLLLNKLYIITFCNEKESYSDKEEKIINEIIHSFKPL